MCTIWTGVCAGAGPRVWKLVKTTKKCFSTSHPKARAHFNPSILATMKETKVSHQHRGRGGRGGARGGAVAAGRGRGPELAAKGTGGGAGGGRKDRGFKVVYAAGNLRT